MSFRWIARRLISTVLAAGPGVLVACGGGQKTDHAVDPPPPPVVPGAIIDARGYQFEPVASVWSKLMGDGTAQALPGFPPELRVGLRQADHAITVDVPLPLGVVIPGQVAYQRAQLAATPEEQAVAKVLAYWGGGDLVVRHLAQGLLITVMISPQNCSPGSVVSVFVVGDAEPMPVDQEYVPELECFHPRGRRPPGLVSRPAEQVDAMARFLAEAVHFEAASVPAFERLARELDALGAPPSLSAAARRAADDEVRHAATMRALGATPTAVELTDVPARDAAAIALDNAVEGGVHEAFAAVLCAWQAAHADDPDIARALARIADDECDHADLAGAIAAWVEPRLDAATQRAIDAAVARALDGLPALAAREAARFADAAAPLGLPSPAAAHALAVAFVAHTRSERPQTRNN